MAFAGPYFITETGFLLAVPTWLWDSWGTTKERERERPSSNQIYKLTLAPSLTLITTEIVNYKIVIEFQEN